MSSGEVQFLKGKYTIAAYLRKRATEHGTSCLLRAWLRSVARCMYRSQFVTELSRTVLEQLRLLVYS